MSVPVVIRRLGARDYTGRAAAFADLAKRARDPNPHMSPASVEAALVLVREDEIVVLSAWLSEALGSDRLVGLWVLRRERSWRDGFQSVLVAPLLPLYEVSSQPVLDSDHADAVAGAMVRHLGAAADLPGVLRLPLVAAEDVTGRALLTALTDAGARVATLSAWRRPVMRPLAGDDPERYLRRALGPAYKKRMQQYRTITKAGVASFRRRRGEPAREAFERFLELEAAGWKGKAGTAIARIPAHATYFRRLIGNHARADTLQIDALELDDEPVAMGVQIESAGTRHFLKITYDEAQARLSPGRALTIAMLQADLAGQPPALFDSGAGEAVDAGTYAWGEIRPMQSLLVALPGRRWRVALTTARLVRRLRAWRDRRRR